MLQADKLVAFIATLDGARARRFYERSARSASAASHFCSSRA